MSNRSVRKIKRILARLKSSSVVPPRNRAAQFVGLESADYHAFGHANTGELFALECDAPTAWGGILGDVEPCVPIYVGHAPGGVMAALESMFVDRPLVSPFRPRLLFVVQGLAKPERVYREVLEELTARNRLIDHPANAQWFETHAHEVLTLISERR